MAITQIQQRNKVYDYATYKTTIPAAGETLAISGAIGGSSAVISIIGDGSSSVDTILDIFHTSGKIEIYAGTTIPSGWLLCDGSAVSRATYERLFAAIGTTWGVGDSSTTFNVPDLRETVPVGIGTRASGVTAHDEYTLAQMKDDQFQGSEHAIYGSNNAGAIQGIKGSGARGVQGSNDTTTPGFVTTFSGSSQRLTLTVANDTDGTPRTGTTTHGKQIGVNYIIKT